MPQDVCIDKALQRTHKHALKQYSVEECGVLFCQKGKVDNNSTAILLTSGYFIFQVQKDRYSAVPLSCLQSVDRQKGGIKLVFQTQSQTKEFMITDLSSELSNLLYARIRDTSVGLTLKQPSFVFKGKCENSIPYFSRPDIFLKIQLGQNDKNWDVISQFFCSRPKAFYVSQFIPYTSIMTQILQTIDITASIKTFVIDCDITTVFSEIALFITQTQVITKIEFNFSKSGVTPPFDVVGLFQAIQNNHSGSIVDLRFDNFFINNIVKSTLYGFFDNRKLRSLEIHQSLYSYAYDDFLQGLSMKPFFKALKEFIVSGICYEGLTVVDPSKLFVVASGIPKVGIVGSILTIPCIPILLNLCPQNIADPAINLDFSYLSGDCDISFPFVLNANIGKINLSNSIWSKSNLCAILESIFAYKSHDLIVDLSGIAIADNDWNYIWNYINVKFKTVSSPYIVGFKWNGNPISDVLFSMLKQFPRLKQISLAQPSNMTNSIVSSLLGFVSSCSTIEKIDISNWKLKAKDFSALINSLTKKENLLSLIMYDNEIDQSILNHLAKLIIQHPSLYKISFYSSFINPINYQAFLSSIEAHKTKLEIVWPNELAQSLAKKYDLDVLYSLAHQFELYTDGSSHKSDVPPQYFPPQVATDPRGGFPSTPPSYAEPPACPMPPHSPTLPEYGAAPIHITLDDLESSRESSAVMGTTVRGKPLEFKHYPSIPPLMQPPAKKSKHEVFDSSSPYSVLSSSSLHNEIEQAEEEDNPIEFVPDSKLSFSPSGLINTSVPQPIINGKKDFSNDIAMNADMGVFVTKKLNIKGKSTSPSDGTIESWIDFSIFKGLKEPEPKIVSPSIDVPFDIGKDFVETEFNITELLISYKKSIANGF